MPLTLEQYGIGENSAVVATLNLIGETTHVCVATVKGIGTLDTVRLIARMIHSLEEYSEQLLVNDPAAVAEAEAEFAQPALDDVQADGVKLPPGLPMFSYDPAVISKAPTN